MISFRSHPPWLLCLIAALWLGNAVRPCEAQPVYRVQLMEKNRQTLLTNEPVVVVLEVDGTPVQSEGLRSDEQGVIDLTVFRNAHQKYFEEYGTRAAWVLWYQELRTDLTKLWQNEAGLTKIQLQLDLGPVLVWGHFVDEKGQRVRNGTEVFPAELRSYLSSSSLSWNQQCRLYSSDETGKPEQMVSNGIHFEEDGSFRLYVPKNRTYRFEWLAMRDLVLVNPTFTVGEADVELKLSVNPKPYCLYGSFLDAASGLPMTEWININGLDVYFLGKGQAKYAVFLTNPARWS